ncbi:hypothetical protein LUZ60_006691 [Juncus effusus]|nr:hypothetical protein LUZ60_006691 [Juncus effusus]
MKLESKYQMSLPLGENGGPELPFSGASQTEITEEVEDNLMMLVNKRLNSMPWETHDPPFTISRVPAQFREKNKMLYEPLMVSIGPHYRGKESLRVLEEHKWRFLQSFIGRRKEVPVAAYVKKMRALEPLARRCYNESVSLGTEEFSLMLLLDGCFILQYFLRLEKLEMSQVPEFNWTFESLQFDLFLLENQIPFFVIHDLYTLWAGASLDHENMCPLCDLIYKCQPFHDKLSWPKISCNKIKHLLHFYYECIVPKKTGNSNHKMNSNSKHGQSVVSRKQRGLLLRSQFSRQPTKASSQKPPIGVIPCATNLHESGVSFKRKINPSDMFDITFQNGVMEMPRMVLNPYLRIIFTNLHAYEQTMSMTKGMFTSFTNLMDSLINTEKDVVLLEHYGIIDNMFQNEEEAATFFNELNDFGFMSVDEHQFLDLFREVQKYSESTWRRHIARFRHDYLSTPWSSMSVFAGVVLLFLSVVQTIFTVYSAFHH